MGIDSSVMIVQGVALFDDRYRNVSVLQERGVTGWLEDCSLSCAVRNCGRNFKVGPAKISAPAPSCASPYRLEKLKISEAMSLPWCPTCPTPAKFLMKNAFSEHV
jgi:hypothetical protein